MPFTQDVPPTAATLQRVKLKCLVLGAANAGKTCLCRRYFYGAFHTGHRVPTLGSDFYTQRVPHPDLKHVAVNLALWDTPGRERFYLKRRRQQHNTTQASSLCNAFVLQADAVMLVYDMTSSTSFLQLLKWYADLMEVYHDKHLPILIVANKLDLFQASQQERASHPRQVAQRPVMPLHFNGKDFRYEYHVSHNVQSPTTASSQRMAPDQLQAPNRRVEVSTFLANRSGESWMHHNKHGAANTYFSKANDGAYYLDSLLNSEDGSAPDQEMVLLWCMRNNLQHFEISAATGHGVNETMYELLRLGLQHKQQLEQEQMVLRAKQAANIRTQQHHAHVAPDPERAQPPPPPSQPEQPLVSRQNPTLNFHERYAGKDEFECFTLLRPLCRVFESLLRKG